MLLDPIDVLKFCSVFDIFLCLYPFWPPLPLSVRAILDWPLCVCFTDFSPICYSSLVCPLALLPALDLCFFTHAWLLPLLLLGTPFPRCCCWLSAHPSTFVDFRSLVSFIYYGLYSVTLFNCLVLDTNNNYIFTFYILYDIIYLEA